MSTDQRSLRLPRAATPALPAVVTGTGPVLLLLHGAGGSPQDNYPFLDDLASDHTVVAPYLPGTAPAPLPDGPLDVDPVADQVVATADAAGVDTFALSGYSLGSALAIRVAARHPERVTALVLTAGFAAARPSLAATSRLWQRLLEQDPVGAGWFVAALFPGDAALHALGRDATAQLARDVTEHLPAGARAQVELVGRVDVTADLPRLAARRLPVTLLVPTRDRLVDPAHSADLQAALPHAVRHELTTGHDVAGEAPIAWLQILRAAGTTP
ncbi:alpha/beta fold hydrolase [Blastococcus sp. SYSU DS0552]